MAIPEKEIIDNEIELMNYIVSQCNKETFVDGGRTNFNDIINHYELPSGLHVYSTKEFSLKDLYDKTVDIENNLTSFIVVSKPIDGFNESQKNGHLLSHNLNAMAEEQNLATIQYRNLENKPLITYSVKNNYIDKERISIYKIKF